jgi:hypothetical protein
MFGENYSWLPFDDAAKKYGYSHVESLRRRIRDLREQGLVVDIGKPPLPYKLGNNEAQNMIIIYWPNHNTALIRSDAPSALLNPKLGKRARKVE